MIIGYTKLFSKILKSSIWNEDNKTRLVWITLLALAGPDGVVVGNAGSLARDANVDIEAVRVALGKFMQPDPESGTPTDDGRRIEAVDGGWRLLNHGKYKAMMSEEHRRAYKTEWQRNKRQAGKAKRPYKAKDVGSAAFERAMEAGATEEQLSAIATEHLPEGLR